MAGIKKKLLEISDHTHADYGKWLSKDELNTYLSASQETVRACEELAGVVWNPIVCHWANQRCLDTCRC